MRRGDFREAGATRAVSMTVSMLRNYLSLSLPMTYRFEFDCVTECLVPLARLVRLGRSDEKSVPRAVLSHHSRTNEKGTASRIERLIWSECPHVLGGPKATKARRLARGEVSTNHGERGEKNDLSASHVVYPPTGCVCVPGPAPLADWDRCSWRVLTPAKTSAPSFSTASGLRL